MQFDSDPILSPVSNPARSENTKRTVVESNQSMRDIVVFHCTLDAGTITFRASLMNRLS